MPLEAPDWDAHQARLARREPFADRARRLATAALLSAGEPVLWIEAASRHRRGWRVVQANAAAGRLFDRNERERHELAQMTLFGPASSQAATDVEQARRCCRTTGRPTSRACSRTEPGDRTPARPSVGAQFVDDPRERHRLLVGQQPASGPGPGSATPWTGIDRPKARPRFSNTAAIMREAGCS